MDFRTLINKLFEDVSDDPFNGNLPPKIKVMSLQDFVQDETVETDAITEDPDKFLGASLRKLSNDELKSYLDRVITKEKEPTDKYKLPYIHRGSVIPIVDKKIVYPTSR
jgi:DNA polymerase II large subunit